MIQGVGAGRPGRRDCSTFAGATAAPKKDHAGRRGCGFHTRGGFGHQGRLGHACYQKNMGGARLHTGTWRKCSLSLLDAPVQLPPPDPCCRKQRRWQSYRRRCVALPQGAGVSRNGKHRCGKGRLVLAECRSPTGMIGGRICSSTWPRTHTTARRLPVWRLSLGFGPRAARRLIYNR